MKPIHNPKRRPQPVKELEPDLVVVPPKEEQERSKRIRKPKSDDVR